MCSLVDSNHLSPEHRYPIDTIMVLSSVNIIGFLSYRLREFKTQRNQNLVTFVFVVVFIKAYKAPITIITVNSIKKVAPIKFGSTL